MDFNDIKKKIAEKGYITFSELKAFFSNEDQEVFMSYIIFLMSKNQIKKIKFQNYLGQTDEIYFIPRV